MKNCRLMILHVFLLQFLIVSCNGQTNNVINTKENVKEDDKIETGLCESELKEISVSEISVSGVLNGFTKNKIQQEVGNPDSTSTYDNEFSNQVHELCYYGKSYFELMEGKVVSFEILDTRLLVEGFDLTVGDNINKCSILLKLFQSNKSQLEIRIPIEGEDSAIIFNLDSSGKIKSIYQWANW